MPKAAVIDTIFLILLIKYWRCTWGNWCRDGTAESPTGPGMRHSAPWITSRLWNRGSASTWIYFGIVSNQYENVYMLGATLKKCLHSPEKARLEGLPPVSAWSGLSAALHPEPWDAPTPFRSSKLALGVSSIGPKSAVVGAHGSMKEQV